MKETVVAAGLLMKKPLVFISTRGKPEVKNHHFTQCLPEAVLHRSSRQRRSESVSKMLAQQRDWYKYYPTFANINSRFSDLRTVT